MMKFKTIAPVVCLIALTVGQIKAAGEITRLPLPDDVLDGKTLFYGAYMTGAKIGWYSEVAEIKTRRGKEVICLRSSTNTQARSFGKEIKSVEKEETWFEKEAPHRFIGGRIVSRAGDLLRHMEVVKDGAIYKVTITEGGKTTTREWELDDYCLTDVTTPTAWMRAGVKIDDTITIRTISLEDLEESTDTLTITGIPNPEKKQDFYSVGLKSSEHGEIGTASVKPDGTILKFNIGGGAFVLRLEEEDAAKRIEELDIDLFEDNIIPIEEKLGDVSKLDTMILKITGPGAKKIPSGPNQKAEYDADSEVLTLTLGRSHGVESIAEGKEVEEALEDTVNYPAKNADVVRLAKKAVKKAGKDKEKQVATLLKFVDDFIRDEGIGDPMTVADIMEKRYGDCTEHALLFVTMARSLGIPAREVSGLYYADELGGFGGHAWAEVALDGKWIPVDPAWNQAWTDPAHVRIYTEGVSEYAQQVVQLSGNLKIEIVSKQRNKR